MVALNVFIHMLEPKDIEPLREIFHSMDTDKTGFITAQELHAALEQRGSPLTDAQVKQIIEEVDEHGNGKINYSEFLAATISVKQFMTEEKLWMMFKHFDVDDTDYISKENIKEAMHKLGKTIT
jgi:calcium-dependent protein kinase